MPCFVYILKCADQSYYTGFTNNLERRIKEHQFGINKDCYTYSRRPVELMFYEEFIDPEEGIAFEKKVKRWSRAKKEALIRGDWDALPELAACNNETSHRFYTGKKR